MDSSRVLINFIFTGDFLFYRVIMVGHGMIA